MQALPAYEKLKFAGPVYLTFDMDVLDPAFAPRGLASRARGHVGARGDCAFTCD